jgi:hypothetical protein
VRKRLKLAIAGVMVVGSAIGLITSVWPWRIFADQEPVVVLTLSWLALLFTGVDGLLISTED